MKHETNSVLIAGGTGFLGYHSALLFLKRGVRVDAVALPKEIDLSGWYPPDIGIRFGDLFAMTEADLETLMSGHGYDTFVYALGPDDRTVPDRPAYDFFRDRLVTRAGRILGAAKRAGIRRAVVLNSYFSFYDRILGGVLSRHHPYVRARVEQENELAKLGEDGSFDVMFLELPFIFGLMPGRKPLWKEFFLDHFAGSAAAFFPRGGRTAAIDVSGVAEAVVAAAANGIHGGRYPVGKENLSYKEILELMLAATGTTKKVVPIPAWIAAIGGAMIDRRYRRAGKEAGLDHRRLMGDILARDFSVSHATLADSLGYADFGFSGGTDVRDSIRRTMSVFRTAPISKEETS